jgi:hypothetical protein
MQTSTPDEVATTANTEEKLNFEEEVSFYGQVDKLCTSKKARKEYKKNVRKCGDYLITDYKNGVCINRYIGEVLEYTEISIPEKLENKPVIKIGCYVDYDDYLEKEMAYGAFSAVSVDKLTIPKTVLEISEDAVGSYWSSSFYYDGNSYIVVDKENPNFKSVDGSLYTKNMKWLLYAYYDNSDDDGSNDYISNRKIVFTVPESVEGIAPTNNFIKFAPKTIKIGRNVKVIEASCNYEDDLYYPIITGYKNTEAQRYAKDRGLKFVSLD